MKGSDPRRCLRSAPARAAAGALLLLIPLLSAAPGCGRKDGAGAAAPAGGAPAAPPEQALPVAVEPATSGDIARHYQATATLEAEKE
ncbi:hypothetical protein FJ250_03960, partial [bacterium]|nr:hypothetical protein [bacterium]